MPFHLRLMQNTDLHAVLKIQSRCYPPSYLETIESFAVKLRGAAGCCWVAAPDNPTPGTVGTDGAEAQAYLVCLPVDPDTFPALDSGDWRPPVRASMLYLHDLAVSPSLRGTGVSAALIQLAQDHALMLGLQDIALIAVQGSVPFWEKHGFSPVPSHDLGDKDPTASFGEHAVLMRRRVTVSAPPN